MKLLLDANLSWRLVTLLSPYFPDISHVDQIGLPMPASDEQIWEHARINNFIIVKNDKDFLNMATVKGFPPKIVLLRTGDQSNDFLYDVLISHVSDIHFLNESTEAGVLEIY